MAGDKLNNSAESIVTIVPDIDNVKSDNVKSPDIIKVSFTKPDPFSAHPVIETSTATSWQDVDEAHYQYNHLEQANIEANPYQSPTASLNFPLNAPPNVLLSNQVTNDSKWHQMSGRIGRLRYLGYFTLIILMTYAAISIFSVVVINLFSESIADSMGTGSDVLIALALLVLLLPLIIYGNFVYPKRRLHDLNLSAWYILLTLIPLVNLVFALYLIFVPGNPSVNQYGYPPRPNRKIHYFGAFAPLVLVFILSIVAAIAIPAYVDYTKRAQEVQLQQLE